MLPTFPGSNPQIQLSVHFSQSGCCVTGTSNNDNTMDCGGTPANVPGSAFAGGGPIGLGPCGPGSTFEVRKVMGGNLCCCGCSRSVTSITAVESFDACSF
jgi:hypothetical protein